MSQSKLPSSKLPWSVPVAIADISEGGKRFELVADEATRAQVAQIAELRSLPRLEATFDVARQGAHGLRVEGTVSAIVGQNCVVTLEPIENDLKEDVEVAFAPPHEPMDTYEEDAEVEIDIAQPEPLTGDTVDLGGIAVEFLILGIDPYPRKPDAKFEPLAVEDEDSHPFAALAALKKGQGGEG
jgi:uncharacterized metal-binding protein YceD (DUF177 family)